MMRPIAAAAKSSLTVLTWSKLFSSASVTTTPGRVPHEPAVGAAQTVPILLLTCITASALAAARVCIPPIAIFP